MTAFGNFFERLVRNADMLHVIALSKSCFFVVCVALFASAAKADFTLSGDLHYWDGNVQIETPMGADDAKRYLRYRRQSSQTVIPINQQPPRRVQSVEGIGEKFHSYKVRFNEDDEEVSVVLEFLHSVYRGKGGKIVPRFADEVLHLKIVRDSAARNALQNAEWVVENDLDEEEVKSAFDILSTDLNNYPIYSFRGMKLLSELIVQFALAADSQDMPVYFYSYLDNIDNLSPVSEFSSRKAFWIYRDLAFAVSENYDVRQPVGGGRALHQISTDLLNKALTQAYLAFAMDDPSLKVRQTPIANAALRKAQIECDTAAAIDECFVTVKNYLSGFEKYDYKDVRSFLTTLGTALELESGISRTSSELMQRRIARIKSDNHLKRLWRRFYCLYTSEGAQYGIVRAKDRDLDYLYQLRDLAHAANEGESCNGQT